MSTVKNAIQCYKTYLARPSLATEIFNTEKCKVLYNLLICTIIFFIISSLLEEIVTTGGVNFSLESYETLKKLHYVILVWLTIFSISLFCYFGVSTWAKLHIKIIETRPKLLRLYNICSIFLAFLYYNVLFLLPLFAIFYFNFSPLASFFLLCEKVRMTMKVHSYIRTNVPLILNYKIKEDIPHIGSFTSFLYFHFAPTLLYQHEYPRTEKTCYKFVLRCLLEGLALTKLFALILEKFQREFQDTCLQQKTLSELTLFIYQNSPLAFLALATAGFTFLHCWCNIFAELLQFGDRQFYKDWWNTPSYLQYYRMWNDVVQDWLYAFVFKDFLKFFPGHKNFAKIMVFFISAVIHEYMLAFTFRIFIPIIFIMFFFGSVVMLYVKIQSGNLFFLSTMGVGFSINICLYVMEYYASINYPVHVNNIFELLIPISIKCNAISIK